MNGCIVEHPKYAIVALRYAYERVHGRFFGQFLSGELVTTMPVLTEGMHLLPAQLGSTTDRWLRPRI
jgi:hypothetical protein